MLTPAIHFLRHWLTAQTRYAVHSPLAYHFVTQVLPASKSAAGDQIDALRQELAHSEEMVEIRDFGAGYGGEHRAVLHKQVREVVRSSARKRRNGELLRRIFAAYRPEVALELGTNLGFSTAYMLAGHPDCRMVSLEGSPVLAAKATDHLQKWGYPAEIRVGEFGEMLPEVLAVEKNIGAVLLDGNHRYAPTVNYFDAVAGQVAPGGFVIVDDIHWSPGMWRAWQELRQREAVSVSIDLFWMGICFLHRNQPQQHFRFRIRL